MESVVGSLGLLWEGFSGELECLLGFDKCAYLIASNSVHALYDLDFVESVNF